MSRPQVTRDSHYDYNREDILFTESRLVMYGAILTRGANLTEVAREGNWLTVANILAGGLARHSAELLQQALGQ